VSFGAAYFRWFMILIVISRKPGDRRGTVGHQGGAICAWLKKPPAENGAEPAGG
jgi:hypothetical protein